MTKIALLNSVEHQPLKVITERGAAYGDNLWFTPTFPLEFRSVQAQYPIFFHKDQQTGKLYPVALFGFSHQENLFLQSNNWQHSYIPLSVLRLPFLIGQQTVREDGVEHQQRVIHIDVEHPRVSKAQGEALFLPFGGNSPYLEQVAGMLETLHFGLQDSQQFVEQLLALELLEAFALDVQLDDGTKHQMIGFYTINEDKLKALSAEALTALHQRGYLQAIYMALASQSNIRNLLKLKNQLLQQAAG
ncbi:multidrug transporter [Rheinheimera riviphila]|uniref:Multidrug transporter n=1 Tax=Rheinheimera riviphila TaxID=1834037 RepID=A0A437QIH1_9GAMM|nr:SapC family protein [Rheinheimera riviphila]RVU34352.1 multidrug transporter [Rheinheimera riviphila]